MVYLSPGVQGLVGLSLDIGEVEPVPWKHFQRIKVFLLLDVIWGAFCFPGGQALLTLGGPAPLQ